MWRIGDFQRFPCSRFLFVDFDDTIEIFVIENPYLESLVNICEFVSMHISLVRIGILAASRIE